MAYIITWGYIAGRELLGILAYRGRPPIPPSRARVMHQHGALPSRPVRPRTNMVHCQRGHVS